VNTTTEKNLNRMAAENVEAIHWLTAPIRFVIDFIKTAIFVVLFIGAVPLIFVGLVVHYVITGHALLNGQDDILPLKVLFCFVIPFVLPIVYRLAQFFLLHIEAKPSRSPDVRRTYVFQHWHIFLIVLGLELAGALCNFAWWDAMSTELDLGILVVYLTSPLWLLSLKRRLPNYPRQNSNVLSFPRLAKASRDPHVC